MKNDLLELKNLGNTSVNWLHAVGVNNYQDLEQSGAVGAYIRVKQRGFRVSKVLLYALQGALMDAHWNDLEPSLKASLLAEAESQLAECD
jgi:DNA transformation protein